MRETEMIRRRRGRVLTVSAMAEVGMLLAAAARAGGVADRVWQMSLPTGRSQAILV